MAHSLFEPVSAPFHEKLWQRVRGVNANSVQRPASLVCPSDPVMIDRVRHEDAHGRQLLLEEILASNPIK